MHGKSDHLIEDGMIAAIALKFDLIAATRNEDDFMQSGAPVCNPLKVSPWSSSSLLTKIVP